MFKSLTDNRAITLNDVRCKGCIHCMRRCPTEAIRVRSGKAKIIRERCISCGDCVRICPTRARIAVLDPITIIDKYKYKIAIPCPSVYGQFNNLTDIDYILTGLLNIGFDRVEELAQSCEIVSETTRYSQSFPNQIKPVINSSCPAVIKLIQINFGYLSAHLNRVQMPEVIAAKTAKDRAVKETGFDPADIGVFIISPCPAKYDALNGLKNINGIIGFFEIYSKLVSAMNKIVTPQKISKTGRLGVSWAMSEGEANGARSERFIAADGIENIIHVLNELDHGELKGLDFIELNACPGGCVGGVMNVANPFLATSRIRALMNNLPLSPDRFCGDEESMRMYINDSAYQPLDVFKLSDNRAEALQKLQRIERMHSALPGIDCGGCGAPSCRAMAEDVVNKQAEMSSCVFKK